MRASSIAAIKQVGPWMGLSFVGGALLTTLLLIVIAETEPVRTLQLEVERDAVGAATEPEAAEPPGAPESTPVFAPSAEEPQTIRLDETRVIAHRTFAARASRDRATMTLPERPDRKDVAEALGWARERAQACVVGSEHEGRIAELTIHVAPSGTVTVAEVHGELAGTAVGSCIARAFRTVALPRFAGDRLVVRYPMQL